MGRKNNDKISKTNLDEEDDDDEDDDDEDDYNSINYEDKRFDIIWETRLEMMKYVDDMGLPICDYLDQQIIEDFIEYLSEQ